MTKGKTDGYGNPIASIDELDIMLGVLPPVRGTYFFADKYGNRAAVDGVSPGSAKAEWADAHDLTVSGRGDGVILMSGGTTLDHTASRLSAVKAWSQHGVYLKGLSSGGMFNRATIRNAAAVVNLANLITLSGNNNVIDNVGIVNEGSDAAALGALIVSGLRNKIVDSHIAGALHATPAAVAGAYDVKLDAAEEILFENCDFGSDSIVNAAANANILVDGGCWRIRFKNCRFFSNSVTVGRGAVKLADATALNGAMIFESCKFLNFSPNGLTALDAVLIGTKQTSGYVWFDKCSRLGFTAWAGAAMAGCVYVSDCVAVTAGAAAAGLATTVSG
jgi:hypothetical protein